MKNPLHILIWLAVLALSGCAAYKVNVTSDPAGAKVSAGNQEGYTPCNLKVPLKSPVVQITFNDGSRQTLKLPELSQSEKAKRNAAVAVLRPMGAFMVWGGSFTAEWPLIIPGVGLMGWAEKIRTVDYDLHFDQQNSENSYVRDAE